MFESILVPLDGSDLSSQILWQVRRLLLRKEAQVELYTVVVPIQESWRERQEDRPDREQRHPDLRIDDAHRYLNELEAQVDEAGGWVTCEVELGDPADRILQRVERTHPALVAMATHGRSGPSRWLRGSVAQRVLRECRAPLLLVNPTAVEDEVHGIEFKTILVPLDGSERAASVLPLVCELATLYESDVVLQRVGAPGDDSAEAAERMHTLLAPTKRELEEAGLSVRIRTGFGHPARAILQAVEDESADLVAMTTHGTSGLARWFFGSVAEKLVHRCPQPLLVVNTRPQEADEGLVVNTRPQEANEDLVVNTGSGGCGSA